MVSESIYEKRKERAIASLVAVSFFVQYFTDIIRSNVLYIMVLLVCCFLFLISAGRFSRSKLDQSWIWCIPLIMIGLSIMRSSFNINVFADYMTFITCFVMCVMSGSHYKSYELSIGIVKLMSIYYAATIWVQVLFPSLYSSFLALLPDTTQSQIISQYQNGAFTGFSSNLAYTAGNILLGIVVLLLFEKKRGKLWYFTLAFFVISLMMTGKRSTFLALMLALMAGYLTSVAGKKRINRLFYIALIVVAVIIVVVLFHEQLRGIPVFGRLIDTYDGLRHGEDVSSFRSTIYVYAFELFRENPIWGIGWGCFRDTTIGNITWVNTIEVHNIYLQLLCEVGIVGFVIMMIPMISSLIASYKNIRNHSAEDNWSSLLIFSFVYQVFFLLYE